MRKDPTFGRKKAFSSPQSALVRICFPLILTGYKFPGGGDATFNLCTCLQTGNIVEGVCAVLLKPEMTRRPAQLGDGREQYPQVHRRILLNSHYT